MKSLINWLCFVCLLVFVARVTEAADVPVHVLEKDGIEIRLMNSPCVDPVSVSQINPQFFEHFKGLVSVWPEKDGSRKAYAGCWAELPGGEAFVVVFADNTNGVIPKSEFRKVKGQVGA